MNEYTRIFLESYGDSVYDDSFDILTEGTFGDILGKVKTFVLKIIKKVVSLLRAFVNKISTLLKSAWQKIKGYLQKLGMLKESYSPVLEWIDEPEFAQTKCMSMSNWEDFLRSGPFKAIRRLEYIVNKSIDRTGDFYKRKLTEYRDDADGDGVLPTMNKSDIKAWFYKQHPPQPITGRTIHEFQIFMSDRYDNIMENELGGYIDRLNKLMERVGDIYNDSFARRNDPDVNMQIISYNYNLLVSTNNQISAMIDLSMEFANDTMTSYMRRVQAELKAHPRKYN